MYCASKNVFVKDFGSWGSMVLQNYQNFIEITSNMIYIVALGVGLKCPLKIYLNTQNMCAGVGRLCSVHRIVPTNNLDIPAHL